MERNYVGQGNYSGNAQSNTISSGRRAGMARPPSGDDTGSVGYSLHGSDTGSASHVPRFGRRASPGSAPTGGGMDMDPPQPRFPASSSRFPGTGAGAAGGGGVAIPRVPAAAAAGSSAAAPPSAGGGGGGMSSKLAGLQRLKEASTARLVSRIPSAGSRTSGETGGYVPSAMTNQQPARNLPPRTNSGGRSGGFGNGATGAGGGYGSGGPSSLSSARSASTGPATAAAGRPPSGRISGSGAATAAAGGGGSGGGYGRNAPVSSRNGEYNGVGGRQPPAAAARRQALAAPPPAPPPPEPQPQSMAPRAPPPPPARPSDRHRHGAVDDVGFGGGGGFGASGGIPPDAEEAGPTGPMVECPTCGRSFNEQAYSKHAKVCEKVFATKRKPVNMAAKRLEGSDAVKFFDLRKGVPKSEAKQAPAAAAAGGRAGAGGGAGRGRGGGGGGGFDDRPLPGSKVPKWKAQSEQLRAAMAANKKIADAKARGMDIKDIKFDSGPAVPDDRIQCPHCGRKFAELTADRHIPKCKDIMAKPGRLAAGGGRGAHMRR